MSQITAKMVGELRAKTGAGLMDCKRALAEAEGNEEQAIDILRKKGIASAAEKAERSAADGLVESYVHIGGKVGVLIELNCETDFVAKTDDFKALVHDIAMHIAAANHVCVTREDLKGTPIPRGAFFVCHHSPVTWPWTSLTMKTARLLEICAAKQGSSDFCGFHLQNLSE